MVLRGETGLGFLAGILSTLSPCVLPLLPIIGASAFARHWLAPAALAGGLTLSFTSVGVVLASVGFASGLDSSVIRTIAAALMALMGVTLLVPRFQAAFAGAVSPATRRLDDVLDRLSPHGPMGQLGIGILLGAVWAPCTGPTLGAAVTLAAQSESAPEAAIVMLAFGLGASIPLLALGYGSQRAILARRRTFSSLATIGRPIMGSLLVGVGLLIASGLDKVLETKLTEAMPGWLTELTTRF